MNVYLGIWIRQIEAHQPTLEVRGSPLAWLFGAAFFLGVLIVGILGARYPYRVVRFHARFSRAMVVMLYGPDWEKSLQRLGLKWRQDYIEYLRRAPSVPESFPARASLFRTSAIFMSVVAALLLLVSLLLLVVACNLLPV